MIVKLHKQACTTLAIHQEIPQATGPLPELAALYNINLDTIHNLPRMPDETSHRYLFVSIDWATRWVFVQIKSNKTAAAAKAFLNALQKTSPCHMRTILTMAASLRTCCSTSRSKPEASTISTSGVQP